MDDQLQFPEIRRAIEQRDFLDWHGLPRLKPNDGVLARQLFPELPPGGELRPRRMLGASYRSTSAYELPLPGYYRLTLCLDGETLVLIEAMHPDLPAGVSPLLAAYGKPTARLGWWYGTLEMPGGEWVYPKRGIALFLNTDRDKALHLALFAPTSRAAYLDHLRPHLKKTLLK